MVLSATCSADEAVGRPLQDIVTSRESGGEIWIKPRDESLRERVLGGFFPASRARTDQAAQPQPTPVLFPNSQPELNGQPAIEIKK